MNKTSHKVSNCNTVYFLKEIIYLKPIECVSNPSQFDKASKNWMICSEIIISVTSWGSTVSITSGSTWGATSSIYGKLEITFILPL